MRAQGEIRPEPSPPPLGSFVARVAVDQVSVARWAKIAPISEAVNVGAEHLKADLNPPSDSNPSPGLRQRWVAGEIRAPWSSIWYRITRPRAAKVA